MIKKAFITSAIVLVSISLLGCLTSEKKYYPGIMGYVKDEQGNPLKEVSIFYSTSSISVQTDSAGFFKINEPRTLTLKLEKEGYHTCSTEIHDFSEEALYDFDTIILNKESNPDYTYQEVTYSTKFIPSKINIVGNIFNTFGEPLEHVSVTVTDSIVESYASRGPWENDGHFNFSTSNNQLLIKKDGFKELVIDLPVYNKDSLNLTLLENSNKRGVYLITPDKYILLPQTKLRHTSEEKAGTSLWGGRFTYNVTDFFYPDQVKKFKIQESSTLRFIVFEPSFSSKLYKARHEDGYLCTASYKSSDTPTPLTEGISVKEIYPPEYSKDTFDEPQILEFNNLESNSTYVFVNSKSKKGYYFSF